MATIGIKHPVYSPITTYNAGAKPTYGTGFVVGKAIKADITVSTVEGKLYGDDALCEYDSQVSDISINFETDEIADTNRAVMFGYSALSATGGAGVTMGVKNVQAHGGFGFYKTKVVNGTKKYTAKWYLDTVFHETGESSETKGENINFQTTGCEGKALPIVGFRNDDYCEEITFTTEDAAKAWLDGLANIAAVQTLSASGSSSSTTSGTSSK